MTLPDPYFDRARGALLGLALGDALGMPSQTLTPAQIRQAYGEISDFLAPVAGHPVSHGLKAAMVTDDTEQSLLLARQILASPDRFDERAWAASLIDWEEGVKARGLFDLLGPSTKRALRRLEEGAWPAEAGREGKTNGAAMRISPLAIATPLDPLPHFIDRVAETCRITHNSSVAIAGAAAVGAVISGGVAGLDLSSATNFAQLAAREGDMRGLSPGPSGMAERIAAALAIVAEQPLGTAFERLQREIGTSVATIESVPTAIALVQLAGGDAWKAACLAANAGDDTDTIGAMAGAMAGACSGAKALPARPLARVIAVNDLQIDPLIQSLLALREARNGARPEQRRIGE